MDDDDNKPESGSSVILTAQYGSIEGDEKKEISLVDAVSPLLGSASHQLLLSSWPISVPWPLAVDDQVNTDDGSRESKKRRTEDEAGQKIGELQNLLKQDIPKALVQLQNSLHGQDTEWLTTSESERIVVAEPLGHERVNWVHLEARKEARNAGEDQTEQTLKSYTASKMDAERMIHRLVANKSPLEAFIECRRDETPQTQVRMPPRSVFLLTNLLRSQMEHPRGWTQMLSFADTHPPNLILLDPPYPNYSAKRLKSKQETYDPVKDLYDLWKLKIPVQQLLERGSKKEGVLVGCWVTNHAKVQRFILTKLFPEWGLHHIGQLVWIKVTAGDASKSIPGGQLVFPLENKQGRKPYEILLLGTTKEHLPSLGHSTNLFASVPLGHSRKPAVFDLLRPLLMPSSQVNVFEFFARTLFSGPSSGGHWISIGNEPFAFNQKGVGYHVNDKFK